jgi:hypothetical protein
MADTQTATRRGRKPVENPDFPHGKDDKGKALAPYGLLENGKPRVFPKPGEGLAGIDAGFLGAPETVPAELEAKAAPARARDERQRAIDGVVGKLHADWVAKGKPAAWDKMPKVSYPVTPAAVGDLRKAISRAADFHGIAVRFGTPVPVVREIPNPRRAENGQPPTVKANLTMVTFAAKDKRERKPSTPATSGPAR